MKDAKKLTDQLVTFELRDETWSRVLEKVADITGLSLVSDIPPPKAKFTHGGQKGRLYSIPEIFEIVNTGLATHKLKLVRMEKSNVLTLVPLMKKSEQPDKKSQQKENQKPDDPNDLCQEKGQPKLGDPNDPFQEKGQLKQPKKETFSTAKHKLFDRQKQELTRQKQLLDLFKIKTPPLGYRMELARFRMAYGTHATPQ